MDSFELSEDFRERFKAFINSDAFKNIPEHSKSDYWKHQSSQIKHEVEGEKINVGGESGVYIPNKSKVLPTTLTEQLMRPTSSFLF